MTNLILCLALTVAFTVRKGLEVTARASEVLMPLIPVIVMLVCLGLITSHDFGDILPVLENGISPVLNTSFSVASFPFGETVTFLMVFPYLNKPEKTFKVSYLAIAVASATILLAMLRDLFALGPDLLLTINFPAHMTARLIPSISVEPLIDTSFLIGGGIKDSILIFAASMGTAQLFKLDDYKPLVTAITAFTVVLSIWVYTNAGDMFRWAYDVYKYYALPFQVIFPIILLITSWIRRGRKKPKKA